MDLFEVKSRVRRILPEMPIGLASLSLNVVWQQGEQSESETGQAQGSAPGNGGQLVSTLPRVRTRKTTLHSTALVATGGRIVWHQRSGFFHRECQSAPSDCAIPEFFRIISDSPVKASLDTPPAAANGNRKHGAQ